MLVAILLKLVFFFLFIFLFFTLFWIFVVAKVISKMKKFAMTQNGRVFKRYYGTGESNYEDSINPNHHANENHAKENKDVEVEYRVISKSRD